MKKWKWYCTSWIFSLFLMNFWWIFFLYILLYVIFIFLAISCKYKKNSLPRAIYNSLLRTFVWRVRDFHWCRQRSSYFCSRRGGGVWNFGKIFTLGDYLKVSVIHYNFVTFSVKKISTLGVLPCCNYLLKFCALFFPLFCPLCMKSWL